MKAKAKPKKSEWTLVLGDDGRLFVGETIDRRIIADVLGDPEDLAVQARGKLIVAAPQLRDLLAEMVRAERNGVPPPLKAATELLKSLGVDVKRKA